MKKRVDCLSKYVQTADETKMCYDNVQTANENV